MASAPPSNPCVMCNVHADPIRQFPCGCQLPIHPQCIYAFLRQGGVCAKCHQVWVPMDVATTTTAWDTGSQRSWLMTQAPHSRTEVRCGTCRSTYFYCICILVFILIGIITGYVLYKVL